jgi:hypothetical protein
MRATKISGNTSSGDYNSSLGRRNPVPSPKDTSSMTVKNKGVKKVSTQFPYDSRRGEIRNHRGL